MFQFTSDVTSDQKAEIDRMNKVLAGLSGDPRATLTPGFQNAGEAVSNLRRVTSQFKPAGFFDPANPAQLQPLKPADKQGKSKKTKKGAEPPKPEFTERGSLLDFANTDMAFAGDVMVAGSFHGFNVYRLGADGAPQLVSSTVCPGGQGDVSIVGRLLIMSVEEPRGRTDCGLQGSCRRSAPSVSAASGSLTSRHHPTSPGRPGADLPRQPYPFGCRCRSEQDRRLRLGHKLCAQQRGTGGLRRYPGRRSHRPVQHRRDRDPRRQPRGRPDYRPAAVFAAAGQIAGLARGDHGDNTQDTYVTDQCHDITVFPAKRIAAGACPGNGILLDISDPLHPRRIDDVSDKTFAYWHSATFNNDGTKVLFTDEWGGGVRPRCQAGDSRAWGADAFYTIEDGKLVYRGHYKLPAPQTDKENCVAHNGSIIPVPGRDIFVQAWYQGGISVIDFTDAAHPQEIAYFDRGPMDKDQLVLGGYWSAYWYKGRIYATEIARGIDVFALEPSAFLTREEIAAAEGAIYPGDVFNPQTQTQVTWPAPLAEAAKASRQREAQRR